MARGEERVCDTFVPGDGVMGVMKVAKERETSTNAALPEVRQDCAESCDFLRTGKYQKISSEVP